MDKAEFRNISLRLRWWKHETSIPKAYAPRTDIPSISKDDGRNTLASSVRHIELPATLPGVM